MSLEKIDWSKNDMEYRFLGNTGLKVSALSLGAWTTYGGTESQKTCSDCMLEALKLGVNYFDNAEVYADGQAETVMGETVNDWFKKGICERSDLVIATKIYWDKTENVRKNGIKGNPNAIGLSRKHIIEGTKASLKRLNLDYVDLIFCHREDHSTPIEETVRAMNYVIDQGWAFYWGTSEWSPQAIEAAIGCAKRLGLQPPVMEQPQYNLLHRKRFEVEYQPIFKRHGYGTTTWSPLASGILTGKYSGSKFPEGSRLAHKKNEWLKKQLVDGEDGGGNGINGIEVHDPRVALKMCDSLEPIARSLGCTQAQLAIAWCVKNVFVSTVITGASRVSQVRENMKALEISKKLTPDILKKIDEVLGNKPVRPKDWGRGRERLR